MMLNAALLSYAPLLQRFAFPLLNSMNASVDLKTLLRATQVKKRCGSDTNPDITNIALHHRQVRSNGLFFAVSGYESDGCDYVHAAIANGAEVIVTEKIIPHLPNVIQIQVPNVRTAVAQIARAFYGFPDEQLRLVGVTGTSGKTTTTWLLQRLYQFGLKEKTGLVGSLHNDLGHRILPSVRTTPDAVTLMSYLSEMVAENVQNAVIEASSQGINQKRTYGIHFDTAVFTNLGHDHLDYHQTAEAYYLAKRSLFEAPALKHAVINVDDAYGRRLLKELPSSVQTVTVGIDQAADLLVTDIRWDMNGTCFTLLSPQGNATVRTRLLGKFNVYNVLAALGVLYAQGYNLSEVLPALEHFSGVPERLETVENPKKLDVFIDFAHKPEALENVLQTLRTCTKGKLYVVFGCGGNRDRSKRPLMMRIAETCADHAWVTSDNPRFEPQSQIFEDMRNGLSDATKADFITDRTEAVCRALKECKEGDCVLIAGKGAEETIEINGQLLPYNDRKTVEAYFRTEA
jgi:UDP-N-acetylmuramoyl-L-alanyl-D-glutamate--2,6-diaminopimelate ligase